MRGWSVDQQSVIGLVGPEVEILLSRIRESRSALSRIRERRRVFPQFGKMVLCFFFSQ